MKQSRMISAVGLLLLFAAVGMRTSASQGAAKLDTSVIDRVLGRGMVQDGAYVVDIPRTDLKVTVQGSPVPVGFDLEHEIRWLRTRAGAMVTIDLVLLQSEVNPVVSSLQASGFEVTAIHNHFIEQSPLLIYVHANDQGRVATLTEALRKALATTGTPIPARPASKTGPGLDVKRVEDIVGRKGQVEEGVLAISKGRTGARMHGVALPPGMGIELLAIFTGTNERARVAGDLVVLPGEANRTIRTLRAAGFQVSALHNHHLSVDPRIFYIHYGGTGSAEKLARTVHTLFGQLPDHL